MRFEDPLEKWMWYRPDGRMTNDARRDLAEARAALARLSEVLDMTPPKHKIAYDRLRLYVLYGPRQILLKEADLARAEGLVRRVIERGGSGTTRLQEGLCDLIGMAANPASVPFWSELLRFRRARDAFSGRRRILALAALALIAIQENTPAAEADLIAAMAIDHEETRAMAAGYLGTIYSEAKRAAPDEVITALTELARTDRKLTPRLMARRSLASLERPLRPENPGGAYGFKVWHRFDKGTHRVIEIAADHSLNTLHGAIQEAWDWGDDHLYSFYLNSVLHDDRYEYAHDYVNGAPAFAASVRIGELGLRPKDRFLYLFDFGDHHVFKVVVTHVNERAEPKDLPRVLKSVGEPMEQYEQW